MRRWLCCACNVEEPYHTTENDHRRSPKHHNGHNRNPEVSVRPDALNVPPAIDVPALSLDELKEKTDNFGSKALIGEGSYGRAYYATLKDGRAVAVKKLDNSAEPESNFEFLTQVSRVSKLQHENFVQLFGYCVEGNLRILAYEFATMGSLHDILHGRKGVQGAQPGPTLDWTQRVRIAVEAARGLEYLHEKVQPAVIHRDVRSSNVLLFEDFKAKIADFNLSNQSPDMAARLHSTRVLGTFVFFLISVFPPNLLSDFESSKMDFELRSAREKLEREQRERKERAKLKLEREKKAKDAAIKQREAIEASQRARRLDAIEAQTKADEHMQESLIAGGGVVFEIVFQAVPFQGIGDKIKLPPSCFTELSDQGAFDKGPLYFELSVDYRDNKKTTHSGVLEFTAEDGTVGLPPHVWSNLFSAQDPMDVPLVQIRYIRLPKGTYAKLQPDNLGFSDLPNHKAILETILRQHATLSMDDVLSVSYGQVSYKLQVLELKPASSVSVLETDIEVDIVSPEIVSDQPSQHVLRPLQFGKPESGTVEEGRYDYYKFTIDDSTGEKVMAGSVKVIVKIDVEKDGADTDLYVSKHPVLFPSLNQHEWSSHDVGSKTLILESKERALSSGTYSIGVYGFKGTVKYQVSVLVQETSSGAKTGERAVSSSSDVDTVECRNCKHSIPSRSIALHEVYCSRHNVVCNHPGCGIVLRVEEAKNHLHCEKCGQALQPTEMEKHLKVFHEPLSCGCGVVLEKEQMVQHQARDCPLRLIACRFCGDMVEAGNAAADVRDRMRGMSEHESTCGSRTAPCDSCGRSVMLKDMDIHQIAVHGKSS